MPIIIQLADLYGRKLAFIIPLWLTILCNVACAFAPSYIWFLVFRFLAGFMTSVKCLGKNKKHLKVFLVSVRQLEL